MTVKVTSTLGNVSRKAADNMTTVAKVALSLMGLEHSIPNRDKNIQQRPNSQHAYALQVTRVSCRPSLVWVLNKAVGSGPVFLNTCLIRRTTET